MTKFLFKIVLVLSFFCSSIPYTFSETILLSINDYPDLALENNFELRVAKLTYLRKPALLNLQNEVLKPQFSITSDPLYGFSNSRLLFECITLIREAEIRKLELEETSSTLSDEKSELFDKIIYLKEKEQFLSEQLEYYIKRKSEKEKLFQIISSSSLEVKIAGVDVNSGKTELFSNSVEIFLSILELYNLNGNSIYELF